MQYIKIQKDGQKKSIEADRLIRFLEAGWTELKPTKSKKKASAKNIVKAEAEIINQTDSVDDILTDIEDIESQTINEEN
jgi:hypothetical protein